MSLVNIRKDSFGNWEPLEILEEEHTIPDSPGPYIVYLDEVPSDGLLEDYATEPPVILSGVTLLTEVTTEEALAENIYFVNYDTGEVTFHSANAGETVTVTYWGLGSLINADLINELQERIHTGTAEPETTDISYEVGTLWVYDERIWVCLRNTAPAIWIEWGGTRLFRRNEGLETSIELDEDCGISVYVNKPLDTTTPEDYLALRINCSGQVYIRELLP